MADAPSESQVTPAKGGRGRSAQLVIVAVLMAGEGVGVFLFAKAIQSDPASAVAAEDAGSGDGATESGRDELAEIELADCRPSNRTSGKFVSFQLRVSALVPSADQPRIAKLVSAKQERIRDRINFVIRSAGLDHLNEPGLETVKRRIKLEINRLLGEDAQIHEVLIPELLQSSSGL